MDNIQEVAAALVAAQAELSNPPKSKMVRGSKYSYTYADLADVIDIVRPVFSKHGLSILHLMQKDSADYILIARILHKSGQSIDSVFPVPSGLTAQEMGSWMTSMRRYSTCNMAFMAGETDEDGKTASDSQQTIEAEKVNNAKIALEELKKKGLMKSAYTGEVIKPEAKPEEKPEVNVDQTLINAKLLAAMQKEKITPEQLHAYYTDKGHYPASVQPQDLEEDYISILLDDGNWKKAVKQMKGMK